MAYATIHTNYGLQRLAQAKKKELTKKHPPFCDMKYKYLQIT